MAMAKQEAPPQGPGQGLCPSINVHIITLIFFSCYRTPQEYFGTKVQREDAAGPSLVVLNQRMVFASIIRHVMSSPNNSAGKESTCDAGDSDLIPGSGRSAGEGIGYPLQYSWASLVAQPVKKSACNAGDLGSVPGLGRSPGEEKGCPLQYSGLETSMDFIVLGVTKSWTHLSLSVM